jgi:UrcA family protein
MSKVIAAAALAAATLAVASYATDPQFELSRAHVEQIRVSYADLDLASPDGAKAMLLRLEDAAAQACGGSTGHVVLEERILVDACVRDTVAKAVSDLHAPLVTAFHEGRDAKSLASISE